MQRSFIANSHKSIKEFSTGDDVIIHLQENTMPDLRGCGGIGGFNFKTSKYYPNPNDNTWFYCQSKFLKLGIYFILSEDLSRMMHLVYTVLQVLKPKGLRDGVKGNRVVLVQSRLTLPEQQVTQEFTNITSSFIRTFET